MGSACLLGGIEVVNQKFGELVGVLVRALGELLWIGGYKQDGLDSGKNRAFALHFEKNIGVFAY